MREAEYHHKFDYPGVAGEASENARKMRAFLRAGVDAICTFALTHESIVEPPGTAARNSFQDEEGGTTQEPLKSATFEGRSPDCSSCM